MLKAYINEWKNYFDFNGRVRRRFLWFSAGIHTLLTFLFIGIDVAYMFMSGPVSGEAIEKASMGLTPFGTCFVLISFIPMLKITVKRLHDLDKTGWQFLLVFIPILGQLYISIVTLFFAGSSGPNRFGEDPKDPNGQGTNEVGDYQDSRSFDHKKLDIVRKAFNTNISKGASVKKISKVLKKRGYEKDEIAEGLRLYKESA